MIKNKTIKLLIFFCVFPIFISYSFADQGVQDLLDRIESSLEQKDFTAYLNVFAPDIREKEEKALQEKYEECKLENVTVFKTQKRIEIENGIKT